MWCLRRDSSLGAGWHLVEGRATLRGRGSTTQSARRKFESRRDDVEAGIRDFGFAFAGLSLVAMRFWRSESDQQTPPTMCIGCRATGGRAGIPRCVAESRWGGKEVGRGRRVVVCRGRRGRGWRYLPGPGLSWLSSVVGRRRRSDVVDVEGKRSFPGRGCFPLASFAVAPWRRMALTSPQCGALATVHMRLGRPSQPKASTPNSVAVRISSSISSTRDEGILFYSSSTTVKHRSSKPSCLFFFFRKAE